VQRVGSLKRGARTCCGRGNEPRSQGEVRNGKFRSDLYFRLSMIELHIPPLQDRRDDIPYLTAAFVRDSPPS
jgi:DNA-binding NtrC family response regulator